jgi:CDP-4-dehydro-6-deoxyglucose reductase
LDQDEDFEQEQPIYLFWGNRNEEDFVWNPVFRRLRVENFKVVSKPGENWGGAVGYVQDLAVKRVRDLARCHVYACGSNNMITSAKKLFMDKGLDERSFYSDAFVQSY